VAAQLSEAARGFTSIGGVLRGSTAPSSLNGPIGPHRRWAWARGRLSDVKTIREAHGGTINDVVLTVITGGFRELLDHRGESCEGRAIRTLVPVSVRAQHERGTYNNKVAAMFAELPVGIADPLERLAALHEQMNALKGSGQAVAAARLTDLGGFAPAMLLSLAGRVGTRLPQRAINTVTTNVPGPQRPLYLSGRRMLEAFPFVPLGASVRIGIAIFSYDGSINFGVTGDWESAPDLEVLTTGIESSIAQLLAVSGPRRKPRSRSSAQRTPAGQRNS
jgi:WS/DGAT/MGAT family acyltransferase